MKNTCPSCNARLTVEGTELTFFLNVICKQCRAEVAYSENLRRMREVGYAMTAWALLCAVGFLLKASAQALIIPFALAWIGSVFYNKKTIPKNRLVVVKRGITFPLSEFGDELTADRSSDKSMLEYLQAMAEISALYNPNSRKTKR